MDKSINYTVKTNKLLYCSADFGLIPHSTYSTQETGETRSDSARTSSITYFFSIHSLFELSPGVSCFFFSVVLVHSVTELTLSKTSVYKGANADVTGSRPRVVIKEEGDSKKEEEGRRRGGRKSELLCLSSHSCISQVSFIFKALFIITKCFTLVKKQID